MEKQEFALLKIRISWLLLFLVLNGNAFGNEPIGEEIIVPKVIKVNKGDFVTITPKTEGEIVKYYNPFPQQLKSLPPIITLSDKKAAVFSTVEDGNFYVFLWTAIKNVPSKLYRVEIAVGEISPDPISNIWLDALKKDQIPQDQIKQLGVVFKEAPAFIDKKETIGEVRKLLFTSLTSVIKSEPKNFAQLFIKRLEKFPKDDNIFLSLELKQELNSLCSEIAKALGA